MGDYEKEENIRIVKREEKGKNYKGKKGNEDGGKNTW